jgi:hypothetical protein
MNRMHKTKTQAQKKKKNPSRYTLKAIQDPSGSVPVELVNVLGRVFICQKSGTMSALLSDIKITEYLIF